jgi:maleamate amidohydrolase
MGSWAWKNGRTDDWDGRGQNRGGNDIIDEIAPQPQDIVIRKLEPSAFSSTPLNAFLTQLGVDSLIVTGT